jgi:hypothetical protein
VSFTSMHPTGRPKVSGAQGLVGTLLLRMV